MIETAISDPLATVSLREMVARSRIPRRTILRWLADDESNRTPGTRFPKPLSGHKIRWNERAATLWFERHHTGERVAE